MSSTIRANRYVASINSHDGIPDADDYVQPLVAGESLSITVAAGKGSALLPLLELVAPDGTVAAPTVKASHDDHPSSSRSSP